jgi:hypothetical protein
MECVTGLVEYLKELFEVKATAAAFDVQHSPAAYHHVKLTVSAPAEHLK